MTDVINSRIDRADEIFQLNRKIMLQRLAEIGELTAAVNAGGGERAVKRHRERGRMLIRERIELLIDPHEYFLELSPLAAWDSRFADGASMVTGVGVVEGTECVLIGNDFTIRGGSINPYTMRKMLRAFAIADENRLPVIMMTESGGGDLPAQADAFVEGGRLFRDLSDLSKKRIPTINIVFGNSTAGGAYLPGMSDYAIMIRNQSQVFLGGPPLVKMATGEDTDPEELGGAEMHAACRASRTTWRRRDERDCDPHRSRDRVATRLAQAGGPPPPRRERAAATTPRSCSASRHPTSKVPFDAREVIARIVDGSRFSEFKPLYGSTLVMRLGTPARLSDRHRREQRDPVLARIAQKGAQFIELCNQIDMPLLFLQNITGFMVGTKYEQEGIIKHGAKLINAVSNSTVPAITIMIGRELRRRQLRDVGPRVRAAVPVHVAEPPHRGDGRQAARRRADIIQRDAAASAARPSTRKADEMKAIDRSR